MKKRDAGWLPGTHRDSCCRRSFVGANKNLELTQLTSSAGEYPEKQKGEIKLGFLHATIYSAFIHHWLKAPARKKVTRHDTFVSSAEVSLVHHTTRTDNTVLTNVHTPGTKPSHMHQSKHCRQSKLAYRTQRLRQGTTLHINGDLQWALVHSGANSTLCNSLLRGIQNHTKVKVGVKVLAVWCCIGKCNEMVALNKRLRDKGSAYQSPCAIHRYQEYCCLSFWRTLRRR